MKNAHLALTSAFVSTQIKRVMAFILLLSFIALSTPIAARASVLIPGQLTQNDREEALRIVAFGTSTKLLSDPYPLGGYAGFEVGISIENLPTQDLGNLGAGLNAPQQEVAFQKISVGKGLYNNIDLFIHFTPYNRQAELSQFGGAVRWSFYQATFLPLSSSFLVHYNGGNIGDQMTTRSYGLDWISGINVNNMSLYAGAGLLQARGTFIGGTEGITDTNELQTEQVNGFHTIVGTTVRISSVFIAFEIDRYTQPVFSGKLGLRF